MGGRPLGIVDMLVAPDRAHAETGAGRHRAGRRTSSACRSSAGTSRSATRPRSSASCTGFARAPAAGLRRAARRRPARRVRDRRPVHERHATVLHRAARPRPTRCCKTDGEALVEVAEQGLCHAARDVSMPGIAGSLLQMIEGARRRRDARPRRPPAARRRAARALAADVPELRLPARRAPEHADAAVAVFTRRGLACAACGTLRRHPGRCGSRRAAGRPRPGTSRGTPLTGLGRSGIAIGWCMTPT